MTGTGFAQQLGFKGGAAYTTLKGADAANYDYRLGYTGGIFLQRHINNMMGLQMEALYTSKGGRREITAQSTEVYKLNYIDIPVLFHLSASGVFVDFGPQISFISSATQITELETKDASSKTEKNITDNPYTIDFAYVGSVGYRAGNGLGLEVRYTGGLKKIDDEGPLEGRDRKNAGFSLMLSYLLGRH